MKIAIFSDNFYPELTGISDSIVTTAEYLGKNGHQVRIYAPRYSTKNYQIANLPEWELDLGDNVSIYRFPSLPFPTGTKQSRLVIPTGFFCMRDLKKFNPDVIHSHQFFGTGIEAMLAAKFLKIPFVGTNHTVITEYVRYAPIKAKWLETLSQKYVNWYYGRCDFISAPSQSVIDEMESFGFKVKSKVISNPIDADAFNNFIDSTDMERKKLKQKFGVNDKTIIYAGRFAPEKNIDVIIKAVALVKKDIPDINLAMAGHGVLLEEIRKMAGELGIAENVKFLGTLDKFELADLYRASEIFPITSKSETQSMTLIQAMACGLPVIGVRARALPEYINDRNGILIEPDDHVSLARNIVELMSDRKKAELLGRGGIESVREFSPEKIGKKWEKLYSEVAKSEVSDKIKIYET